LLIRQIEKSNELGVELEMKENTCSIEGNDSLVPLKFICAKLWRTNVKIMKNFIF